MTASPFESFNARSLRPRDVAATFIPPAQFSALSRSTNTLLIGPRGSGKTTLLKMLTPEALFAWAHEDAAAVRSRVNYTGIFVPTDVAWGRQLALLTDSSMPTASDALVNAAFCTAVLRALVGTVAYRIELGGNQGSAAENPGLQISGLEEARFAGDVAEAWGLPLRLGSMHGLAAALSARLMRLHGVAGRERLLGGEGRSERLATEGELHLNLIAAVSALLDVLEAYLPDTRGQRWALLFDELELAPSAIREQLLAAMRSVDDRLLFKLSISPYSEDLGALESALGAMPGNDYEEVLLTYGQKEDSLPFSAALFSAVTAARGWSDVDPARALGRSEFDTPSQEWASGSAYSSAGRLGKRYRDLAAIDASFANYLRKVGLNVERLEDADPTLRAATLRKITALVAVRSTFRASDNTTARTRRRTRSRKNPELYRGATSFFAMLEGNPRWLIGTANELLAETEVNSAIPASRQARAVGRTAARFRSLLSTIPTAPGSTMADRSRGLLTLIDRVGEFLGDRVVLDDFNPDPPGTFIVDASTAPGLLEALGKALNAGAIVYVPDPESAMVLTSLKGKRFRLSYVLSPHFHLPLRLGRPVSLRSILGDRADVMATATGSAGQLAIHGTGGDGDAFR